MPPPRRSKPRSPEHAALGDALRQLRHEAGLSQEQLAEGAQTDLTQVGGIERGVRNPSHTTLLRLAVLDQLEAVAPVYAARGNGDNGSGYRPRQPDDRRVRDTWVLRLAGALGTSVGELTTLADELRG